MTSILEPVRETEVTLISEGSRLEGNLVFHKTSRIHGELFGTIQGTPGSILIFAETSVVEGTIRGDTIVVDGFIRGEIHAQTRVTITASGRVLGNIHSPSLKMDFGAYFEGQCVTGKAVDFT